jgi:uncharacterized protein (DUF1330 family)
MNTSNQNNLFDKNGNAPTRHNRISLVFLFVSLLASTFSSASEQPVVCADDAKSALMIVEGFNRNYKQYQIYTKALSDSKLYAKLGGRYLVIGDPVDVFEGEWPIEKYMVIVRFPCLARAQRFWNSETYAKIKPLREGAGEVRAIVFEEIY